MSERRYRLTDIVEGQATVLAPDGSVLGTVEKRETHYNLRRVIVARRWNARTPAHRVIAHGGTRREVCEALVRHAELPGALRAVVEALARIEVGDWYQCIRNVPAAIRELRELGYKVPDLERPAAVSKWVRDRIEEA